MSSPLLSAPLTGGRVLELRPDGRAWRLSLVVLDGDQRRQAGGISLGAHEWPLLLASLQAMATYATRHTPEIP